METLFKELFAAEIYKQNLADYKSVVAMMDNYVAAGVPNLDQLQLISNAALTVANRILDNGTSTIYVYISAYAIYMLTLKYQWQDAPVDQQPALQAVIVTNALNCLNNLAAAEAQYMSEHGLYEFANFKYPATAGKAMSALSSKSFGASYGTSTENLIVILRNQGDDALSKMPQLTTFLSCMSPSVAPYEVVWSADNCDGWAAGYPVATFVTNTRSVTDDKGQVFYSFGDSYVACHSSDNIADFYPGTLMFSPASAQPSPFEGQGFNELNEVCSDSGSLNPQSFSVWAYFQNPGDYSMGHYNGGSGGQPNEAAALWLYSKSIQVELGEHVYDTTGNIPFNEDWMIYLHPQFAVAGIYIAVRSYDRPSPDTVPGIDLSNFIGFCLMGSFSAEYLEILVRYRRYCKSCSLRLCRL